MPAETDPRRLYRALVVAAHAVRTDADRRARALAGITAAQAGVLFAIAEHESASQRTVAGALGLGEPALTGMVQRLLDAGLVQRERSATDPRAWRLRLTAGGREALERIAPGLRATNALLLDGFDDRELDIVERFLLTAAGRAARPPD